MIKNKIMADLTEAMKKSDATRTAILRLMKTEIESSEMKSKKRKEADDDMCIHALRELRSKLKQAHDVFESKGIADKAQAEAFNISVINEYLPTEIIVSDEELNQMIEEAAKQVAESGKPVNKGIIIKTFKANIDEQSKAKNVSFVVDGEKMASAVDNFLTK